MSRYRWVDSQRACGYEVNAACTVAEVSTSASGYEAIQAISGVGPVLAAIFVAEMG